MGSSKKKAPAEVALLAKGVPPNLAAMRRAAEVLGIRVPAAKGDALVKELLGALRIRLAELLREVPEESRLRCDACGEVATEDTDFCPYCGDLGEVVEEGEGVGIAVAAPAPADVETQAASMGAELDQAMGKIQELSKDFVGCSYDLGVQIKLIQDRQLYRAKGFETFKDFAEAELPMSRTTAYKLVKIVETFKREDFLAVGYKKLRTIALLEDGEQRDRLVDQARQGATAREIQSEVDEARGRGTSRPRGAQQEASEAEVVVETPAAEHKPVTLLAKVSDRPMTLKFRSAATGKVLKVAAVLETFQEDAYAEVQISDDLFLRIGLGTKGNELTGLVARFERAEELAEPAE